MTKYGLLRIFGNYGKKKNCKNEQCFKSHVIYVKWSYSYNDRMFIIGWTIPLTWFQHTYTVPFHLFMTKSTGRKGVMYELWLTDCWNAGSARVTRIAEDAFPSLTQGSWWLVYLGVCPGLRGMKLTLMQSGGGTEVHCGCACTL